MSRSLQRHLSLMLGGAVLLAGLAAALASFGLAYQEAKEFQDDMLRQITALIAVAPAESADRQRARAAAVSDSESEIVIVHLPSDTRPVWLAEDLAAGFHTLDTGSGRMRVYVRKADSAKRIVVAQPTDTRDELALDSALRTLIPLVLLLPLLTWLVVRIVRSELAPVAVLSRRLDEQPADRPGPLVAEGVPSEIAPFVQAINRLLERVQLLMDQQRRFVSDAAHELRSPLTALSIQAQNLRRSVSPADLEGRVESLLGGVERARRVTEQLLSLAGTQAGKLDSDHVDVGAMGRELIAEFLPLAEAKRLDLGLELAAPLILRTSPGALRVVLRNALENAVKYTPGGGEVTMRILPVDGAGVVEIVDSGPGIAQAEHERVFDAFYRSPGAAGEGSGLGLAIARESASRMGASISLAARPGGGGLIFRLILPATAARTVNARIARID